VIRVSLSIAFIIAAMSAAEAKTPSVDEQMKTISKAATECLETAVSTYEMGACFDTKWKAADKLLNQVYKSTVATLKKGVVEEKDLDKFSRSSEETLRRLVKAQRAWISFRDSDCELQGAQMLHGTGEGLVITSCLAGETLARAKEVSNVLMSSEPN
jgi:uncharacterized protein YecT (DUF1311 family)